MEKKEIKIKEVLAYLEEGKTREEIAEIYELSRSEVIAMFKHPKLKGKKTKKAKSFILIDEDDVEETNNNIETVENKPSTEEVVNVSKTEEIQETVDEESINNAFSFFGNK